VSLQLSYDAEKNRPPHRDDLCGGCFIFAWADVAGDIIGHAEVS